MWSFHLRHLSCEPERGAPYEAWGCPQEEPRGPGAEGPRPGPAPSRLRGRKAGPYGDVR